MAGGVAAGADGRSGSAAPAIELVGISKAFGAVQANKDIDLTVTRGTIHGIVGENGAGKSTLMSILYGCLLYTSPSPRDGLLSRMPSSA